MAGRLEAQQITYLPERGIGVADRSRPDYDPIGYHVDGLLVYPAIDVSAIYNDNFRATSTDEQGDVYAVIRPSVRVASNWGRHSVEVTAYYEQPIHVRLTQEDVPQFGGSATGRYDISRETALQLVINGLSGVESRTAIGSFIGSVNPVKYDTESLSLSLSHTAGDLELSVAGGAARFNYQNVLAGDGTIIDQSFRDVSSFYGNASAAYRVAPGVSVVVSGEVDKNDYSFRPGSPGFNPLFALDRRSTGYTLQGGVNFELSSLLFGTIQVGLLDRDYRDPRLRNFSGPSITAQLLWNVTPLTTVRFNIARTVEDTATVGVAGNLRTRFALTIDHELYRYIIVTPDVVYSHISPNGPLPVSDELAYGIATKYLVSRHVSIIGRLRHMQRTSDFSLFRFKQNTIGLTVRYNF